MNRLTFIALSNEFCETMQTVSGGAVDRHEFIGSMVRLLPRIYISATDLRPDGTDTGSETPATYDEDSLDVDYDNLMIDGWAIESLLDEDYYEAVRRSVEALMGEDDTYLEVFEDDMKYSEAPIAASIAEGLTDIFQVLYNYIGTVRDATEESLAAATAAVREDFAHYWSKIVCNVLRALNQLYHNG